METLKPVDLRTCKPGDRLRSKHGIILTYCGLNPYGTENVYPHNVKYPNTKEFGPNSYGTRTDDGFVVKTNHLDTDHDIVEILKPESTNHKDFFGKEIFVGDTIALLERCANSVYIRKGTVIGHSPKMVKIKYIPQGATVERETSHLPYNLIKA